MTSTASQVWMRTTLGVSQHSGQPEGAKHESFLRHELPERALLPPPTTRFRSIALPPPAPPIAPTPEIVDTARAAATPALDEITPASLLPTPSARTGLDDEIRGLLDRATEKLQRERAERRELDAWVVSVVSRLAEVESHRQMLEDRTQALETRLSDVERTGGPGVQQAQWRIQLVDQRLSELERRQAHRRAFSWWPSSTADRPEQPPDQSTHPH